MNRNRLISSNLAAASAIGPSVVIALAVEVIEPGSATEFFKALGLSSCDGDGAGWTVSGSDLPCITVSHGQRKRLRRLTFGCPSVQIDALNERARSAGWETNTSAVTGGVLVAGPDGVEIVLVACDDVVTLPERELLMLAHAPSRSDAPAARPLALSHVAIFVADFDAALAFYIDIVGLRLSDRCGSDLAFLHSPQGSHHHILALVRSDGPGLHHYSFEMGTIDAIGLRAAQMADAGYRDGWGMGRHVLGSNFFHYVRDPWGSHAELTTGLDSIPADADWVAGDHSAHDAFYMWGPPPPANFIDNPERPTHQKSVAA